MKNHGHKSNRMMNEETEELDGSLVTIKGDVNELTNGKVSIMEDADTFKSPYKILQDISNVWDELTDKQQANLAEKLFGKNRANIGISIIQNFKQAEKAMDEMAASAGDADREMGIIKESLSYKFNALKETGTGIFQNLFQRGNVGTVVTALTAVLSVVEKITESVGLLGTVLIGGAIFKSVKSIVASFATLKSLNVGATVFDAMAMSLDSLLLTMYKFLPIILAVTAAIAAFSVFDNINSGWTRAQKAMDETVKEYEDANSKLQSLQSERDTKLESAKEIATKYNVDVTGLETVDEVIAKIRSSDVGLTLVDDAELSKLSSANTEVETQIKLQQQLADAKHDAMVLATQKATQAEKTYWEEVKGRHNSGFFGTIAAGWDYLSSMGDGKYYDDFGNVIYDEETKSEKFKAIQDKTSLGLARASLEDYKAQKEELDKLNQDILNSSNVATQEQIDRRKELSESIQQTTDDLSGYIESLSGQAETLSDSPFKSDQDFVKGVKQLLTDFENIGKSAEEIALNNLNNFFDGSGGKNVIKDELIEAAKEGENLTDVLDGMGLSLRDLGLENSADGVKMLNEYFSEFAKSAEEAENALGNFRVSADDVKAATESENRDADWSTIQSAYKAAKELEAEGKTGVDDYQKVAQFFSSKNLSALAQQAKDAGGYASDVYQEAFHEAQAKADRWFGENEAQSLMNFADDMQTKGMFTIDKSDEKGLWDIQSNFKNSAQAAKEMGVSIEAVETLLAGLEAYGYDFSGIEKSGEMITEYESALNSLNQTYAELEEGSAKDRLGQLLNGDGGFNEQYNDFLEDMSNLSEEQVIRIRFEYDLSQLQQDIDEIEMQQANGNVNRENNAELLTAQQKYIQKSKEGLGLNQEGIQLPVEFVQAQDSIDSLRKEMANTDDPDKILELQARIKKDQDLQKEILDEFSETHPEITPKTDVSEINNELQKDYVVNVDAEVNSSNIDQYLGNLPGATITYTANVDGVEQEISAVRNSDGTITYTTVIDGETVPVEELNKEGTITYTTKVDNGGLSGQAENATVTVAANTTGTDKVQELTGAVNQVPPEKTSQVTAQVHGTSDVNSLTASINSVPSSKTSVITTIHRTVNQTVAGVDGTAHVNGTAFAQGNWGTSSGGVALAGELGSEIVVFI